MAPLLVLVSIFVFLIVNSDGCNTTYSSLYGEIRSPEDPGTMLYPNHARCTYTIFGNATNNWIDITFVSFNTELNYDYLTVDNDTFSGTNVTNGTMYSYPFDRVFTMQFRTDGSVTSSGFTILYRLLYCPSDQYGPGCRVTCPTGCKTGTCDLFNPICECKNGSLGHLCDECIDGFYGENCSRCNSGCSDVCSKDTGRCTCKPGRTGTTCNSVCPSGTYDSYCTKSCSPGCVDGSCNKEDGRCSCKAGFMGTKCSITCSSGFHGPGCTEECSDGCRDDRCDAVTGSCQCLPGWTGANCNQRCLAGFYGVNCSESCSSGCSGTCSREDGRCTCKAGWEGEKCEYRCPADRYGVDCESNCSLGCAVGTCQSEDGICTCQAGWTGFQCQENCTIGKYGAYCDQTCSVGCEKYTCNSVDGTCICIAGYQGDQCTVNVKLIGAAAGGSAGFLLLLSSVLGICCCIRRKRSKQNHMAKRTTPMNEHELKNINAPRQEAAQSNAYVGIEEVYSQPIEEGSEMMAYEDLKYNSNHGSVTGDLEPHISKESTKSSGYVNVAIAKNGVEKLTNSNDEECYENVAFAKDDDEEIPYENFTALKPTASNVRK